jgi:hypothetical protein
MPKWKKGPKDWSPSGYIPGMPVWPEFVDAYLEASILSGDDQSGNPLFGRYTISDFAQEAVDKAVRDSNRFIDKNMKLLDKPGIARSQHGHEFWMARNYHDAGFRDRRYVPNGHILRETAGEFGREQVIVGGDDKLRFL